VLRARLIRIALAALVPLALAVGPAAAAAPGPGVGLGDGQIGQFQWAVVARPAAGGVASAGRSAPQPCLVVGTTWHIGPFDYRRSKSSQCAGRAGLSASDAPLIARGVQPSTRAPAKITAVGIIASPAVRRVRVTFADGSKRVVHLHRLNPLEARRSGFERFGYAAFAVHGEWCAEQVVAENASGKVLWDSGEDGYACGAQSSGPPRFAG
jgi:hypothetical protein